MKALEELERLLHDIVTFQRYLGIVKRRGHDVEIVKALLVSGAAGKSFFANQVALESQASELTTSLRTVSVATDAEHNSFALAIEDRSGGFARRETLGIEFIQFNEVIYSKTKKRHIIQDKSLHSLY